MSRLHEKDTLPPNALSIPKQYHSFQTIQNVQIVKLGQASFILAHRRIAPSSFIRFFFFTANFSPIPHYCRKPPLFAWKHVISYSPPNFLSCFFKLPLYTAVPSPSKLAFISVFLKMRVRVSRQTSGVNAMQQPTGRVTAHSKNSMRQQVIEHTEISLLSCSVAASFNQVLRLLCTLLCVLYSFCLCAVCLVLNARFFLSICEGNTSHLASFGLGPSLKGASGALRRSKPLFVTYRLVCTSRLSFHVFLCAGTNSIHCSHYPIPKPLNTLYLLSLHCSLYTTV